MHLQYQNHQHYNQQHTDSNNSDQVHGWVWTLRALILSDSLKLSWPINDALITKYACVSNFSVNWMLSFSCVPAKTGFFIRTFHDLCAVEILSPVARI